MVPVYFKSMRYGDAEQQALLELHQPLTRKWRFAGLILASMLSAVTAVASVAASVMGTARQGQIAHFVHQRA